MNRELQFAFWHAAARLAAWFRPPSIRRLPPYIQMPRPRGISVVIPSRNGRSLLAAQLPGLLEDARRAPTPFEVIVADNGSSDGTAAWLGAEFAGVAVDVSQQPLSFAAAVNRGIRRAGYSHICLLNNDMLLDPGFFPALLRAFDRVPDLFCATAQIRFPAGVRREETGKAVMAQSHPDDFPLRCDEPVPGEDLTWVLYGSGGCSLYDAAMLRALGGVDEAYAPAYVEDLDLGYRAWQRGWPSVFVAGAVVEHRHRATTSRYYSEEELAAILEVNYLRFLARAVADGRLYRRLWNQAIGRLRRRGKPVLRLAAGIALQAASPMEIVCSEAEFLALTGGDVAVFPGAAAGTPPLIVLVERLETPSPASLAMHSEVIEVKKGNIAAWMAAIGWSTKRAGQKTSGQAGK